MSCSRARSHRTEPPCRPHHILTRFIHPGAHGHEKHIRLPAQTSASRRQGLRRQGLTRTPRAHPRRFLSQSPGQSKAADIVFFHYRRGDTCTPEDASWLPAGAPRHRSVVTVLARLPNPWGSPILLRWNWRRTRPRALSERSRFAKAKACWQKDQHALATSINSCGGSGDSLTTASRQSEKATAGHHETR
jgi:hypothetical protein